MGKAKRIKYTVFSTQYKFYTHIGLVIFKVILSYWMLFSTGPFVILLCILVSFFLNMLENIAYFLQNPFLNRPSDTPLSALRRSIEIYLKELAEERDIPYPLGVDAQGVLM